MKCGPSTREANRDSRGDTARSPKSVAFLAHPDPRAGKPLLTALLRKGPSVIGSHWAAQEFVQYAFVAPWHCIAHEVGTPTAELLVPNFQCVRVSLKMRHLEAGWQFKHVARAEDERKVHVLVFAQPRKCMRAAVGKILPRFVVNLTV
jgi:hypothetical protein